jgi:hypothetical protein
VSALFSEPGWPMHTASEIGTTLSRPIARLTIAIGRRRCAGCSHGRRAAHDGRFAGLDAAAEHYNSVKRLGPSAQDQLGLSAQDQHDLVEYLKSL